MTREGIIDFVSKQKTSNISSVGEDGYPETRALVQPMFIFMKKEEIFKALR